MRLICALTVFLLLLIAAPRANAYSVLSHEALIDSAWEQQIQPLLLKRFPQTSPDDLLKARAYAYGGCIIQDMGYYPFGNRTFSDLLHYVRAGDFVEQLVTEAADVNEYAFALGALAHYAADVDGHRVAVNHAVPVLYPKMRAKFGDEVTYEDCPPCHVQTEFAFDVLQVSQGLYAPAAFHSFIGFEVAKPLLERAFLSTYGFELKELFGNLDLAIGTYRKTVSGLVPKMTKVALATRESQMKKAAGFNRNTFLYRMSRRDYEKDWGNKYYKPKFSDRLLAWFLEIVPKVGPFRALAFRPPTPAIDAMFMNSFRLALERYRNFLVEQRAGHLQLANLNLDTGAPLAPGKYKMADHAVEKLAQELAKLKDPPPDISKMVVTYLAGYQPAPGDSDGRKQWAKTQEALAKLKAATPAGTSPTSVSQ